MGRKKSNKQSSAIRSKAIPRFSYSYYGLNKQRVKELQNGCRTNKYPLEMLQAACGGFEFIRPWILLSVTKKRSYDRLEFDMKLGRIPIGKNNFYGVRRFFFHNLDMVLRERDK